MSALTYSECTDASLAAEHYAQSLYQTLEGRPLSFSRGDEVVDWSAQYLLRRTFELLDLAERMLCLAACDE